MWNNSKIVVILILVILTVFGGTSWFLNASQTEVNTSSNITGQSLTNVAYANLSSAEKMDIYLPNTTGPYPVIIAVHGGSFYKGDKNSSGLNKIKQAALDRGYVFVSINYRLSSEAKFPAQINDVKAALRYLRANAKWYNMDPP